MYPKYSYIGMHSPGIEPGTADWKSAILPLNYECLKMVAKVSPSCLNRTGDHLITSMSNHYSQMLYQLS